MNAIPYPIIGSGFFAGLWKNVLETYKYSIIFFGQLANNSLPLCDIGNISIPVLLYFSNRENEGFAKHKKNIGKSLPGLIKQACILFLVLFNRDARTISPMKNSRSTIVHTNEDAQHIWLQIKSISLSLIHIFEPTRLGMISYAVF